MLVEGRLILMLGTKMVLIPKVRTSKPLCAKVLGAEMLSGT